MTAISTAIETGRVSAIVGYEIKGILEGIQAGNLPQRIAVLAEANTANQVGLPPELSFTTAKEVGDIYGYGSPAHIIARILRPNSGDILGGIPTVVYPVLEAGGATVSTITIGITGTASKNTTHRVRLSGRDQLDGDVYSFAIAKDDTGTEITPKILNAVNNILGAPAIVTNVADDAVFTSKWKGISSAEMNIIIETDGDSAGLTYSEDANTPGAGLGSTATALASFGDNWNTIVINAVGADTATLDALEAFNGNPNDKSGRYAATVFKPFVALFGDNSLTTLSGATTKTDGRKNEVTNVLCPAPNSTGFSFEAAANVALIYGKIAQDTPHNDPLGRLYPDMPTAEDIGEFSDASKRDQIVKVGSSTVKLNSNQYEIIDLVTTSHPDDEPQTAVLFRWVRDLVGVDWNIRYRYLLLENININGKTLISDTSISSASGTISPKRWKGILTTSLFPGLEDDALIVDQGFSKESLNVEIDGDNTNRFNTIFKTKRSGIARVLSTTNQALFNFGG